MSDYIRKEYAMDAVQDHFDSNGFKGYDDGQKMMDRIKGLPSDDVVKVVRCKDCKYWQAQEVGIVECPICTRIQDMVFEMGAYGFCSRGERKGGDE